MKTLRIAVVMLLSLAVVLLGGAPTGASPGATERVSVAPDGSEGNHYSYLPDISSDGRFVAFGSAASNLVPGDTNGLPDIFVHDRETGESELVSVASDGSQGNDHSEECPAISGEGRLVAFMSLASNLVPGDTNGVWDVFVHDRETGQTERVSVDSAGGQGNHESGTSGLDISGDGRFVAFESRASNLVPGDTTPNGQTWSIRDIFVHDRQTGETERVSVASDGSEANHHSGWPSITGSGRFVAFQSIASNLVPGDTNGYHDIFVHDRQTGQTERVSIASDGSQANGETYYSSISSDGRFVAFASAASNLVSGGTSGNHIFVHDRQSGETELVSVASDGPGISSDGRFVAFWSPASDLVPGDTNGYTDVFVHDRQTGQTERVSVASDGSQGNHESGPFVANCQQIPISGDGRFVAFTSAASNLVPGDTNSIWDVFVHDREVESVTVEAGAGETVTTDIVGDGATSWDPLETSLTTPNPGTVSIEEVPITGNPPQGFRFLAQQVNITAPDATPEDPLVIVFRIDSSSIPEGEDETTIRVRKDAHWVKGCRGDPGIADPDPCVSSRALLPDGDIEITVLTSTASVWNLAAPMVPVGGMAELPDVSDSSGRNYIALAALAAVGLLAFSAGAWYARRRLS